MSLEYRCEACSGNCGYKKGSDSYDKPEEDLYQLNKKKKYC